MTLLLTNDYSDHILKVEGEKAKSLLKLVLKKFDKSY